MIGLFQSCASKPAPEGTHAQAHEQPRSPWQAFPTGSWAEIGMFKIGHEDAGPIYLHRDEITKLNVVR